MRGSNGHPGDLSAHRVPQLFSQGILRHAVIAFLLTWLANVKVRREPRKARRQQGQGPPLPLPPPQLFGLICGRGTLMSPYVRTFTQFAAVLYLPLIPVPPKHAVHRQEGRGPVRRVPRRQAGNGPPA